MKLALFNDYRLGLVTGSEIRDVSDVVERRDADWPWAFVPRTIGRLHDLKPQLQQAAERARPAPLDQVRLLPPLPSPSKVLAAVANYVEHHAEMGGIGQQGEVFLKAPSSVVGPGATVVLPNVPGREVHYEGELAAVVGQTMRNVAASEALQYVCGYTILMDLTVRGEGDRSRRKSYDGFTPLGPWIVTTDEIPDPQALRMRLWRNGELRQDTNTKDMTFSVADMLSYASSVMTLYPGDVLSTGSPPGVGQIRAGDRVVSEIEGIGRLEIAVEAPPPDWPVAEPGRRSER